MCDIHLVSAFLFAIYTVQITGNLTLAHMRNASVRRVHASANVCTCVCKTLTRVYTCRVRCGYLWF